MGLGLPSGLVSCARIVVSEAWILSAATAANRGRVMGVYTSLLSVTFATGPLILRDKDGNIIPTQPDAYPVGSATR